LPSQKKAAVAAGLNLFKINNAEVRDECSTSTTCEERRCNCRRAHGRAMLVALTPEAYAALGAREREITRFPYRVGRESRETQRTAQGSVTERRDPGSRPTNDCSLRDREEPVNVSREHFAIDRGDTGCILVDQASTCGTLVEGQRVGERARGGRMPLHDGDVILVGTSRSPYVFTFRVG
jgi:FHA domain